jgi:hypothetical protein
MSNEKKEIETTQDLISFISNLVNENPNDQILGSKIRYFMNNIEEKNLVTIAEELKKMNS